MRRFQRYPPCRWTLLLATLIAGLALLGGCDTSVDLPEDPPRAFSMWGTITPERDTQTVKVFPMGAQLTELPAEPLEATFTSENLETGRIRSWRDSVMREADGERVHVYWASFTAEHGHTYRFELADARRGTSRAEVTVPEQVDLELLPPRPVIGRVQFHIPGDAPNVVPEAELDYLVQIGGANPREGLTTNDVRTTVRIRHPISGAGDGWRVQIPLEDHAVTIDGRVGGLRQKYGLTYLGPCCKLELVQLTAHVRIVNQEWQFPGDTLGVTPVTQPGVRSNVENGFGMIGAGYTASVVVPVSDSLAKASRFRYVFSE